MIGADYIERLIMTRNVFVATEADGSQWVSLQDYETLQKSVLEMPIFEFVGDDNCEAGTLDKVAIDWSKQIIRGSLTVKSAQNHPNIKKKIQLRVVFFKFSDVDKTLHHLTSQ